MAKRQAPGAGRPSKGDRDVFMCRPSRAVGNVIRAEAERLDVSFSDYIATLLAHGVGLPDQAPIASKAPAQGELSLQQPA